MNAKWEGRFCGRGDPIGLGTSGLKWQGVQFGEAWGDDWGQKTKNQDAGAWFWLTKHGWAACPCLPTPTMFVHAHCHPCLPVCVQTGHHSFMLAHMWPLFVLALSFVLTHLLVFLFTHLCSSPLI